MTRTGGDRRPGIDVLACGLVTLDLVNHVAAFPEPDTKITATTARIDIGGPATNAARTASRLGSSVHLATLIGSGPAADIIRARLTATDLAVTDATPVDAQWSPPLSCVTIDRLGRRTVVSANAVGAPEARQVADTLPASAVALVDGHHLGLAIQVAAHVRAHGGLVVLDGGSWKQGLQRLLPFVHVAIISADFVVPAEHEQVLAAVPVVARSNGPDPILARVGDLQLTVTVPRVHVVDTLGAGDVLHGAFAHLLARDPNLDPGSIRQALTGAASAASDACTRPGIEGVNLG